MISSKAETIISDDKIRNCNFIVTIILFELEKRDLGAILSRKELLEALEEWNLEFSKTEISISLSNVCHDI